MNINQRRERKAAKARAIRKDFEKRRNVNANAGKYITRIGGRRVKLTLRRVTLPKSRKVTAPVQLKK